MKKHKKIQEKIKLISILDILSERILEVTFFLYINRDDIALKVIADAEKEGTVGNAFCLIKAMIEEEKDGVKDLLDDLMCSTVKTRYQAIGDLRRLR